MNHYYYKKQRLKSNSKQNNDIQLYIHKNITISLRLNDIIHKNFKQLCQSKSISINEMINQLIRQELRRNNIEIEPKIELIYGKDWEL